MDLHTLCEKIALPKDIAEAVCALEGQDWIASSEETFRGLMKAETAPEAYRLLAARFGAPGEDRRLLFCYLECARRAYEGYRRKGIPDRIYFDTMKVFTRFLGEEKRRTGVACFNRGRWTWRQICMRLFRIGELEYETVTFRGKNAVSIHIPSDACMEEDSVTESLKEAALFFAEYEPAYENSVYVCDSWLLSPRLGQMLGRETHIMKFQGRFEIVETDETDDGFIPWVFETSRDADYAALPEDTSLRRAAKAALLRGERIGSALGILRRVSF